ncbi:hypothetical protein BWP39_26590 [Paraburkholderia acidicola]|uniref:Uncharacterized protein n=1 Tax=Paraburkholderia acidicola TaxID=1912599 RepID=A0A2A4ES49_9BURK|nr:hypothetical protein BWP39_26590 [Paraburkholderia acidicola]
MVVPPVKTLLPVNVSVPVPCLVKLPVPAIDPLNTPSLALPTTSLSAPRLTSPEPINVPTVCVPLPAERSSVVPDARSTVPVLVRLAPAPNASVPELTNVPPV